MSLGIFRKIEEKKFKNMLFSSLFLTITIMASIRRNQEEKNVKNVIFRPGKN